MKDRDAVRTIEAGPLPTRYARGWHCRHMGGDLTMGTIKGDDGYVLACQSIAQTDRVSIDYS